MRVAESYCSPVQTTSSRENSVNRTSTSFIPSEFDFETGRLSDARLGSHRLGGGIVRGIATSSSRELELPRTSETFVDAIDTEADQDLELPRTSETFVDVIETETSRGYANWWIGGRMVKARADFTLSPKTLSLSFETDRAGVDFWRQYDRAGDVQVKAGFAGQFEVVDRGNRDPITVEPPFGQQPPFDIADYYVNSYQETQAAADRFEISMTLQRTGNRSDVFGAADETGGFWTFEFDRGTIALEEAQVRQASGSGTTAGRSVTLPIVVDDQQAATIVDTAGFPDAVVDRSVPDGKNFVEDSSGGRQTVTIDAPASASLDSGTYLIQGWRLSFAGYQDDRWRVELELAEE